jgi:hypothetical protein
MGVGSDSDSCHHPRCFRRAIAFCEPRCYLRRLFDAPNLPSLLLVVIGAFGVLAAVRTLTAIEKQVDAQVNTERAWIEVNVELGPNPAITEHTDRNGSVSTIVVLSVKWLNVGRTPAWINLTQIGLMILPDASTAPELLPDTKDLTLIGPEMLKQIRISGRQERSKPKGELRLLRKD